MDFFCDQSAIILIFLLKLLFVAPKDQNLKDNSTYKWERCGISKGFLSTRVVGGTESPLNAWPWMVAIFERQGGVMRLTNVYCGGAIISHKHILTAAHCVEGRSTDDFLARLGEHDIYTDSDGATPVDFKLSEIIVHEKYRNNKIEYDIAILKVDGWINFRHDVQPICLPTEDMRRMTFEKLQPYIAGWGRLAYGDVQSSTLRHVQLEVESNEICGIAYSVIIRIKSNQLCAGYNPGGKDACQGDSGGPLVIPVNNSWYAIGVVSVGIKCAEPGYPGIFSRITAYIDWIGDILTNKV